MTTRPGTDAGHPGGLPGDDDRGRSGLRRQSSAAPASVATLTPGTVVAGRYRLSTLIGQGGMGQVYRAEQLAVRREVALKIIHAPEGATEARLRFEREALAASRITSPHVVTIHDFGHGEGGLLYLAMELLSGESLAQRILRVGAIQWPEAVAIAAQIARALQVAHSAGVVHRDLKPDNIFLVADDTGAGHVKVLDFGIARITGGDQGPNEAHLTSTDLVVGTPLYMSPEACSRGAITPAADLYSLGVMLFEMITGKPPWHEREPVVVMSRHLEARPPRMSERRPDLELPPARDELVDRLLRKKPEDRGHSAASLLTALRELTGSRARVSAPPPRPTPIRAEPTVIEEPPRASSRMIAGIVAGALALAALAALLVALVVAPRNRDLVVTALPPGPPELGPPELAPAPAATEPAPAPPEALPVAPAPSEPATVRVRFEIHPADAVVSVDGTPVDGAELTLPRDGAMHAVEIAAEGHEPRTFQVTGDVDRVISVDLVRAPRRARSSERRAPPRTAPRPRDPLLRSW